MIGNVRGVGRDAVWCIGIDDPFVRTVIVWVYADYATGAMDKAEAAPDYDNCGVSGNKVAEYI